MNGLANNLKSLDLLYHEFNSGNNKHIFYRSFSDEIDNLMDETKIKYVGVDSFAYLASQQINRLGGEEFEKIIDYQLLASEDILILGCSLYELWIGKK